MSAATASVADVSRMDFTNRSDRINSAGHPLAQCTPMPLPALGTRRIIKGNGTIVGTVISLQCPAKHKLVGGELMCIMDTNSTRWVGDNYCKPLPQYEDFGFRVAVLASIVSSAIILFMSMAFIACCLLDCVKEDKRKKQERESDTWQWEEPAQHQEGSRSLFSHKGRNNNNNNSKEKGLPLWSTCNPVLGDNMRGCRYHEQYIDGPGGMYNPTLPRAALPGLDYDQPLIPQNSEQISRQYPGHPPSSCPTASRGLVLVSAEEPGPVWQHGGQQSGLSGANPSNTKESSTRNKSKEFSIRIISV